MQRLELSWRLEQGIQAILSLRIFGLCWEEMWSSMLKGLYMGLPGREHEIIKTKLLPELE
jgi:hypothetical protein